eukprot:scaffold228_cov312-Pinguiococcus_pyrenoidosus.AAC.26
MRPQAMYTAGDTQAGDGPEQERPQERLRRTLTQLKHADHGPHMYKRYIQAHRPVDVARLHVEHHVLPALAQITQHRVQLEFKERGSALRSRDFFFQIRVGHSRRTQCAQQCNGSF